MGRRVVQIQPSLLQDWFTHGVGEALAVSGLPEDASFVRAWYDGSIAPHGIICLLFESDEWPPVEEGYVYPIFMPVFEWTGGASNLNSEWTVELTEEND